MPRTPHAHRDHCKCKPCGCWTGTGGAMTCKCGASYQWAEVFSFLRWRCYDCNRVYVRDAGMPRRSPPAIKPLSPTLAESQP